MNKKYLSLSVATALAVISVGAKAPVYTVKSPSGNLEILAVAGDTLSYSVVSGATTVVDDIKIAMLLSDNNYGINPKVKKTVRDSKRDICRPVVPTKFSEVPNDYNAITLIFNGGYSVEFRAFDDGVAHRFISQSSKIDSINVVNEIYDVTLPLGTLANLQQCNSFKTSYENVYSHMPLVNWRPTDEMSTLPVLMQEADGVNALFCETDLTDYPAKFLKGDGNNGFSALFPKVPVKFGYDGDRSVKILEEAPYIARTSSNRSFPWRYIAIGSDADIYQQTLSCRLSTPSLVDDTSWIKPGAASWEWWNGATPYGPDVNFESGYNLDTYKYFIDFASKFGIPYIIMDEGWAMTTTDPYTPNPKVDVHEIVRYGREKGVGVFLWLTWLTVENNFESLFKTMSDWGVKGLKIDFMDRSDQWMVNFYERVVREAAKNQIMVDMHGSFKPAGLEIRYPNLMSYEGVRGMEQMGGCRPDNTVYLPFMRNAVGPMDYTPGAMISMQPEHYRSERPNSASIGTRAYQMALFPLFETGIQMLADNPTLYYRNPDCTEYIASVPLTWDETRLLDAKIGQYVAVAKRHGDTWWVSAICDNESPVELSVPASFLGEGRYDIEWFEDGINANNQAMDYRHHTGTIDNQSTLSMKLARNGGWTARIAPAGN